MTDFGALNYCILPLNKQFFAPLETVNIWAEIGSEEEVGLSLRWRWTHYFKILAGHDVVVVSFTSYNNWH